MDYDFLNKQDYEVGKVPNQLDLGHWKENEFNSSLKYLFTNYIFDS